jgi:hypothetical protein
LRRFRRLPGTWAAPAGGEVETRGGVEGLLSGATTRSPTISSGTPGLKPGGGAGSPRSPARATSSDAAPSHTPELWHWEGQYFFDKATGSGGVNIANFRVLGQPASFPPGTIPPEFAPYFDQGGGGANVAGNIPADPACAAKVDTPEERQRIYARGSPPPSAPAAGVAPSSAAVPSAVAKQKKCKRKKRCKKRRR